MTIRHVTKIGVLSLGKVFGVIYALFGLIVGAMFTLTSLIMGSVMGNEGAFGMLFGIGAIIIVPVFYGIMGAVAGIIVALIYNVASGLIGGLEVEVE